MMKKSLFLIVISLLLYLSESSEKIIENNSVSKLISMVRMEIIDKSLKDLPRRKDANILKMVSKMVNAKEEYSLNEAESAYLIFKWISENIEINFYDEDLDDPINAYNSGKGTPKALSSLFNSISYFLKVVSESISGYLKWASYRNYAIENYRNYTWNYIEIEGEYYLLDVSLSSNLKYHCPDYIYLYFGTEPEIFIRQHFPNENKWQLLSEPYTLEKFESMALLTPFFYLLGFKTISPDTTKFIGDGQIILTHDKSTPKLYITYECFGKDLDNTNWIEDYYGSPDNKLIIDINSNNGKCLIYNIVLIPNDESYFGGIAYYSSNYSQNSSLDFKKMIMSNSSIEYNNNFGSKILKK